MSAKRPSSPLETAFGPLEVRVLDALWLHGQAACVRDLHPQFPNVAYTTLMTTLDRLFRKGALARHKQGRAFYYAPMGTKRQLISRLAESALATMLPAQGGEAARPILSMFVDTLGQRDRALLDELEALVRERRAKLDEGKK